MQVQKLPSGIEGFDDICHGGLPNARSSLVSGTSGTGKTVFSLQYLHPVSYTQNIIKKHQESLTYRLDLRIHLLLVLKISLFIVRIKHFLI